LYVRNSREMREDEVDGILARVPFCLKSGLTRGQAFDLLDMLEREHVQATVRRASTVTG
jgi:hypothetical protein